MGQAYLGIITSRGLESLVAETEHAMPFLQRRAYRRYPHEGICCWAVIKPSKVGRICALISAQQFLHALIALNVEAQELGTIPPDYDDIDLPQIIPG